jgi:spore coat polysaccharide biosynthesis protein SpsF
MKYFTIIQTRTTSSRLPAKCFLPIAGMPLVKLCFKRVSSFSDTCVAISVDKSDDLLASYLQSSKISYFRGHLTNVLKRFTSLCLQSNLNPNDTVIRLTGDNPLVDNIFLERMKKIWEKNNLNYLSAEPDNLAKYGWPKGLSAEFFKVQSLYEINSDEVDEYTKEHVTPSIKKNSKISANMAEFEKLGFFFKNSYGIDTFEDYLYVADLFQKVRWDESYIKILEFEKNI